MASAKAPLPATAALPAGHSPMSSNTGAVGVGAGGGASGGGDGSSHGYSNGYFVSYPQDEDDRTLKNTIANAHRPPAAAAASSSLGQTAHPYMTGGSAFGGNNLANNNIQAYNYNNSSSSVHERERSRQSMVSPSGQRPGTSASAYAGQPGGGRFAEEWGDTSARGVSSLDEGDRGGRLGGSSAGDIGSGSGDTGSIQLPSRSNTLKKKSSLRRSGSRRSMKAGSVRSLALHSHSDLDEAQSAFFCPVPTKSNPTEALAIRFQAWRKVLKDLIIYHREIQNHNEQRAKSSQKLFSTLNSTTLPPGFLASGGLDDAAQVLRGFHKQTVTEAVKAREIEEDVILALTGLRSDLNQKIKEIKGISGDFKNNVDKEMDATRRAVRSLQDVLGQAELDTTLTTGRQDPYLLRLAVDRQLERQLSEENYLHQAFLNLEKSGRELESIVVGEIQKSYNAFASILKREAGTAWATVEELRNGPVSMPKDHEWAAFIHGNEQFVDPNIPIRSFEFIHYPGQNHYACQEIRAGLLERKSKYLKSYTAGWYVLSPTHLHEFKSADKMQAPVMSLYLPEQKLGSHSTETASSSKFVLKGRQTGSMHRGHTWVFRAESFETMMAWYEDIKALTEKTWKERTEYARGHQHTRSISRTSQYTYSSDGVVNEEDDEPFAPNSASSGAPAAARAGAGSGTVSPGGDGRGGGAAGTAYGGNALLAANAVDQQHQSQHHHSSPSPAGRRPSPGGRFPSDLTVTAQRGLQVQETMAVPLSPTSVTASGSGDGSDHDAIITNGAFVGGYQVQQPTLQRSEYAGYQDGQSQLQHQQQQQFQHFSNVNGAVKGQQQDLGYESAVAAGSVAATVGGINFDNSNNNKPPPPARQVSTAAGSPGPAAHGEPGFAAANGMHSTQQQIGSVDGALAQPAVQPQPHMQQKQELLVHSSTVTAVAPNAIRDTSETLATTTGNDGRQQQQQQQTVTRDDVSTKSSITVLGTSAANGGAGVSPSTAGAGADGINDTNRISDKNGTETRDEYGYDSIPSTPEQSQRPRQQIARQNSEPVTISSLHIPGGFPRGSTSELV